MVSRATHRLRIGRFTVLVKRPFLEQARTHGFLDPESVIASPGGVEIHRGEDLRVTRHELSFPPPARDILLLRSPGDLEPRLRRSRESVLWSAQREGRGTVAAALALGDGARSAGEAAASDASRRAWERIARAVAAAGGARAVLRPWLVFTNDGTSFRPVVDSREPVRDELAVAGMTLAARGVSLRARLRALRAFAGVADLDRRELLQEVARRARDPRLGARAVSEDAGAFLETVSPVEGRLVVARRFEHHFGRAGIESARSGLAFDGGRTLRRLPDRENVYFRVEAYRSGHEAFYMKRFSAPSSATRALAWLGRIARRWIAPGAPDVPRTRAAHEWHNLGRLRALGIRTADPAALGESIPAGAGPSFVATREIRGATPLDDWIRKQSRAGRIPAAERRRIVLAVARLAATLHRAGGFHKDLYLCHLLVREEERGPALHLIDLDRMRFRRRPRLRWFVKDLAALDYSADRGLVSRAERLRFLREYRRRHPLALSDAVLVSRIERRVERLRARAGRHRGRGS